MTTASDFQIQFDAAVRNYEAGLYEAALLQFQRALALDPQNLRAIAACATALSELNQPQASYALLASHRDLLWNDAEAVVNLAIGAETLGLEQEAIAAYTRALRLDTDNLRALNNLALRHAAAAHWGAAIENMRRCATLAPAEPRFWSNWIDFLNGGRRDEEALFRAQDACERFPQNMELLIRRFACLAFNGQIDLATASLVALGPHSNEILARYLVHAGASLPRPFQKHIVVTPDAFEFFCLRAFDALNFCDWRRNDEVTQRLLAMVQQVQRTGEIRDWRDTQFYAMFLDLDEHQQLMVREVTVAGFLAQRAAAPPWRSRGQARPSTHRLREPRLRIGISLQFLGDLSYREGLLRQLQLHDRSQFAFFMYSPAAPELAALLPFKTLDIPVIEIGHMTDAEAVGRIRLDQLDLWMDDAMYTVWCRPELPILGVAPIHIRRQTWCRIHPSPHFTEYSAGDRFTHPHDNFGEVFGHVFRFASTCWVHTGAVAADLVAVTRQEANIPEDALVLAVDHFALAIDPYSFATWMRILQRVPRGLLLLPAFAAPTQANLAREARAHGIDPERIRFLPRLSAAQQQAHWRLADLCLDTLRFNANQSLADLLQLGVPAVSVAGQTMASRLGGSILAAAGLADCVLPSADAYVDKVVYLAQHPSELASLRQRLQTLRQTAPLFDLPARVRDWENAWRHMIGQNRAGLTPASFKV